MQRAYKIGISFFTACIVFFLVLHPTFAQEIDEPTPTSSPSAQASQAAAVNYNLAYPGILPDNPLYKLKVLRDKIIAAITTDPEKKINFYLLQTDKGMLATAMLTDKKKYELATQTALKAENNYTLLTQTLYRLQNPPSDEMYKKLHTASVKHQLVLTQVMKKMPKDKQNTIKQVIDFSKRNWEEVAKYKDLQEENLLKESEEDEDI